MDLNYIESYFNKRGMEAVEFLCIENYCVSTDEKVVVTLVKNLFSGDDVPNLKDSSKEWRIRNVNMVSQLLTWTTLNSYERKKRQILMDFYSSNKSNIMTCAKHKISPSELFELRYDFCFTVFQIIMERSRADFPPDLVGFIPPNPW